MSQGCAQSGPLGTQQIAEQSWREGLEKNASLISFMAGRDSFDHLV